MNDHFFAVGNPAPPRPRRFERETSSMICAGVIERAPSSQRRTLRSATYASHHVPSAFLSRVETHRTVGGDERLGLGTGWRRRCSRAPRGGSRPALPARRAGRRTVRRAGPSARSRTHTGTRPPSGQLAARSRLARANSQLLLDAGQHVVCSAQQAGQARADAKLPPARRLRAEHRVEGHHFAHVRDRDPQMASDPELRLGRNMTELSCTSHKSGNIAARGSS